MERPSWERPSLERIAFVATAAFAGASFWFAHRLPMVDLPQHAGQVAVWRDLLLGTSPWQSLLSVNYFTPYLAGYGLALLLSFVLPVSAALKLLLMLGYFGFVAACVALRGRLGGDRRLDWLFIPGFFGYAYVWGFYTFLIVAPFGVLFVVLAHRYADRPTPMLGAALLVADVALFFSHGLIFVFASAIGGVFLLLKVRPLVRLVPAALPYVIAGLVCLTYVLVRLRLDAVPVGEELGFMWGWGLSRWSFLVYSVGAFDTDWIFLPLLLLMLAAPMVLGARLNWRDRTALVPFLITLLVAAFVPINAMNTGAISTRFALFLLPFYALMFSAPGTATTSALRQLWLPVLCWAFLLVHTDRLLAFAREAAGFEEVLAVTKPGHRALGLILDPESAAASNEAAYHHFPLWYQAENGGLVDFNFSSLQATIVRYRAERMPPVATRSAFRLARAFDWTRDDAALYRYFFIRHTAPLPPGYFPAGRCAPTLLKSAGAWSVFENVNCHDGSQQR
jgi:hypothetical protein